MNDTCYKEPTFAREKKNEASISISWFFFVSERNSRFKPSAT